MITINERAQTDIKGFLTMIKNGAKAKEHLPTYIEALASAMNVPEGWLFDPETMAFGPPPQGDGDSHSSEESQ